MTSAEKMRAQADTNFGRPASDARLHTGAGARELLPETFQASQQQSAGRAAAGASLKPDPRTRSW